MSSNTPRDLAVAHAPVPVGPPGAALPDRTEREDREAAAPGARRHPGRSAPATGPSPRSPTGSAPASSGTWTASTTPSPFRRLAGKCQVFLAPEDDHLRTRLTHAIEVCQVAVSIARPTGLNVALTAAAATGHDCGHGPAGHASEGALSPFLEGGYHHAVYGADVVLAAPQPVRRDARRHPQPLVEPPGAQPRPRARSWPGPTASPTSATTSRTRSTPASCRPPTCPTRSPSVVGRDRRTQLHGFITAMVDTIAETGCVGLRRPTRPRPSPPSGPSTTSASTCAPRPWPRPTCRPGSSRSLAEFYLTHPSQLPDGAGLDARARRRPPPPPSATCRA